MTGSSMPARNAAMSVPPVGPGAFIAYPGMLGGYERAIDKAVQLGLRWLAPRGGQRGRDANWGSGPAIRHIAHAKSLGVAIYPWLYSHPDSVTTEIELCRQFVSEGAAGVIIDAEDPWKSPGNPGLAVTKKTLAAKYMLDLRRLLPDVFVAHCPYAFPAFHGDFPYAEFNSGCDLVMPQLYWTEFNNAGFGSAFQRAVIQWQKWNAFNPEVARPIAHIGVTYGHELKGVAKPPPGELRVSDFRDFLITCGPQQCLPLYSLEAARPDILEAVRTSFATPVREPGLQLGDPNAPATPLGWADRAEYEQSQVDFARGAYGAREEDLVLWDRKPFAYRTECALDCTEADDVVPPTLTLAPPTRVG